MSSDVFILSAKRTPIGRFLGALKDFSAPQLGSFAIRAALEASGVAPHLIDTAIMGQVLTAGAGQAPARQAALYAGLPESVQALTVGKVCGSGLQAVVLGAQSIMCEESQFVVAGGQESMSKAPYLLANAREGFRMGHKSCVDSLIADGLWDPYNDLHMGSCADACAQELPLGRDEQDRFALESYTKARQALEAGFFTAEVTSVACQVQKQTVQFVQDEEPHAVDLAKIASLRPAFTTQGTITAGNASKINDGAAALVLASASAVAAHKLQPMARLVSWASHAQAPKNFPTAPIFAIQKALKKAGLSLEDISFFEINEAFALVPLAAMKELSIPADCVNIHGGACALGHPIGASGARILVTLLHTLRRHKKRYGLATLCIGGGEGIAVIIEAL